MLEYNLKLVSILLILLSIIYFFFNSYSIRIFPSCDFKISLLTLNYKVLLQNQKHEKMNKYALIFRSWFGYAAMMTLVCILVYITVQQVYRSSANDPQLQMAQDVAIAINKSVDPKSLPATQTGIEISEGLSPYVLVFDPSGNIVAGSATLNGKVLRIPQGVIDYIRKNGRDAASWQPQPGVRQAMVGISAANGKYIVAAGRSLSPTEERIGRLGEQVVFGWVMSLIGMLVVAFLQSLMVRKPETT